MDYGLYVASLLGAVALVLLMPHARRPAGSMAAKIGLLLGSATLGGVWLTLAQGMPERLSAAGVYYYLFSAIAITAAVRVITHTKPVYAALWFIMIVLAVAGLFLLTGAEFMAFAMVIIYGGAILVTYVFVIMLASEPGVPGMGAPGEEEELRPAYERTSREPIAACTAGFLLLAVLLSVIFKPLTPNPQVAMVPDATVIASTLPGRAAERLSDDPRLAEVMSVGRVTNSERVGLDLFESHPLGLELAGVILLVSLVGAVIIARQRVENPLAEVPE